jgi:hypothetical protein
MDAHGLHGLDTDLKGFFLLVFRGVKKLSNFVIARHESEFRKPIC